MSNQPKSSHDMQEENDDDYVETGEQVEIVEEGQEQDEEGKHFKSFFWFEL